MQKILNAKTGLACALGLALGSFAVNEIVQFFYVHSAAFASWYSSHHDLAQGCVVLVQSSISVTITFLFSRDRSFLDFLRFVGLRRRPTLLGWLAAWVGFGAGVVNLHMVVSGLAAENRSAEQISQHGGVAWLVFVAHTALLSPLFEELTLRGFLYRAFRGSHGIAVSSLLVLSVQTYFHMGLIIRDPIMLAFLLAGGGMLCLLRERTDSTWNCVLSHAAYNAVVIREWRLWIAGAIVALACCTMRNHRMEERTTNMPQDLCR